MTLEDVSASDGGELPRDKDGRPLTHPLLGQEIPNFSAPLTSGGWVSKDDLAGQWTVIDFWGLWCSDCLADAPYSQALQSALLQDPQVGFLSIHTPPNATRADEAFGKWGSIKAYFQDMGYTEYPIAIDKDASLRDTFQIGWTPTYLLISPDLKVHAFRNDLSVDPEDGIKPVIQQITELSAAYNATSVQASAQAAPTPTSAPPATISNAGVAGLSGPTPFELWAIKKAFDGYDVFSTQITREGETLPAYEVRNQNGLIMLIEGDVDENYVSAAIAVSREIKGPLGETIGVSVLGDLPQDVLGECAPGLEEYAGMVICGVGETIRLARVFELPETYEGPDDVIPPQVGREAILKELRYYPGMPE